jgi:hypothetical protein
MRKDRQVGLRVGLPAFFCMELEEYHKHASGAHRALAFPDFLGFLVGLGLEAYRMQYRQEAPDITPEHIRELSEDYEEAMRPSRFREWEEAV